METNEWDIYTSNLEFNRWLTYRDLDMIFISDSTLNFVRELYTEYLSVMKD